MTNEDEALVRLVGAALAEDVGDGDVTTLWTVGREARARAHVVAKEELIVAGTDAFGAVYGALDPEVQVDVRIGDGSRAAPGDRVIELHGPAASILTGERTALNFLGRLSGIATTTARFVAAVAGTGAKVVDTRKTTPAYRVLEKRAVRAGGGTNHRQGLHDMVLIKDNHIAAAGGISSAVEKVRGMNAPGLVVEVEVSDEAGLEEALAAGVDRVMLDNMSPERVARAVARVRVQGPGAPRTEASGNIDLESVRAYAEAGVDYISVGALTHSARVADFSMRIDL